MKSRVILALACLCFLVGASGADAPHRSTYKLGAILPLSGDVAHFGTSIKNGIELALEELPPHQRAGFQVVYEDAFSSASATSAFQKLTSVEKINAALVFGSGMGNALGPQAERMGLPLIAIGASDSNVVNGKRFVFTHWVAPETEVELMVEEMKRRGFQKVALVTAQQEGMIAIANATRAAMKAKGISDRLVLDETFLADAKDFKSFVTRARADGVDAFVVVLWPGPLSSFAKQVRQQGLNSALVGVELFEDPSEVKASEGALVGQWCVTGDEGSVEFTARFNKRYGTPVTFAAANAYDSLRLIAAAVEKHGNDGELVANALRSTHGFSGALGTYSATGDNRFALPAALKVVKENGFERLVR